jgi:hypothetical protein
MKEERKEIFLEVSMDHFKEIEKFPGFMPIYTYPKISDAHCRAWGYFIQNEIVFFFRIKHESEIIKDIIEQVSYLKLLIYGLKEGLARNSISIDEIQESLLKFGKVCDTIIYTNK